MAKTSPINLGHFEPMTRAMGPGLRSCLWVRGCSMHCSGCISPGYQQRDPRCDIDLWEIVRKIRQAKEKHGIEGVSISGGEPFDQSPLLAVLAETVHRMGLSTLAWSGYTRRQLEGRQAPRGAKNLLAHLDVLIDGPFQSTHQSQGLPLRGSDSQQIHLLTDRYHLEDLSSPCLEMRLHENGIVQMTGVMDYAKALAILELLGIGDSMAMSH